MTAAPTRARTPRPDQGWPNPDPHPDPDPNPDPNQARGISPRPTSGWRSTRTCARRPRWLRASTPSSRRRSSSRRASAPSCRVTGARNLYGFSASSCTSAPPRDPPRGGLHTGTSADTAVSVRHEPVTGVALVSARGAPVERLFPMRRDAVLNFAFLCVKRAHERACTVYKIKRLRSRKP